MPQTNTPMLPGLGGGTAGAQLQPGQLGSATAPMTTQNMSVAVAPTQNVLSGPTAASAPTTLPTPTPGKIENPSGTSDTGHTTTLPGGVGPVTDQPAPTVTQMLNTPVPTTDLSKYGTQGTAAEPKNADLAAKYNALHTEKKGTDAGATNPMRTQDVQDALGQHAPTDKPDPQAQFMDQYSNMNPVVKTMFDNVQNLLSSQNTKQTLVDEFTKLNSDAGIQGLKTDLLNVQNIMKGSEDDIPNEITKAGGFATNSQVAALTAARNKTLLTQATYLQDQIQQKEDYIKQIMDLTKADYADAAKQVDQQIGLDEKMADLQLTMDSAATDNYQKIVDNIGYDGLANSLDGNVQAQNFAESKLGLPKGSLSNPIFLATAQTLGQKQVEAAAANTAFDNSIARERLNLDEAKFKADQQGTGIQMTPQNQAYVQAFNNATAGMGAQSAKQAQTVFGNYLAQGNLEGARDYIVRTATANAPADQQNQAVGRAQALGALSDISMMLAALKAKGVDTNLYTGTLTNVANKLGTTPDPELNAVGSRILQALITYRKGMTGVAFGPQEAKDYEKIFPDYTNTDQLNTTKIAALQDALNGNNKATLSFYIGADNYNSLFPSLDNDSGGGLNLLEGGSAAAPDWGAVKSGGDYFMQLNGVQYVRQADGTYEKY